MPKINKDFSDALGFRLLSTYTGFIGEYPVEAARIQKIYDDNFRETCIKCYPIIAEAGVDPQSYESKLSKTTLKNELRTMFPVKPIKRIEIVSDEEEEDETTLSDLTQQPKPKPISPRKCLNCETYLAQIKTVSESASKLMEQNKQLTKQNEQLNHFLSEKNKELRRVSLELAGMKTEYAKTKRELENLKSDPEFISILDYQRKKRRQ
jgi:hypothetical protein